MRAVLALAFGLLSSAALAGDYCVQSPAGDRFEAHGVQKRQGAGEITHPGGSVDRCGWLTSVEGFGMVWCATPGSERDVPDMALAEEGDYSTDWTWDATGSTLFGVHWDRCERAE